jgi:hypothetical protein
MGEAKMVCLQCSDHVWASGFEFDVFGGAAFRFEIVLHGLHVEQGHDPAGRGVVPSAFLMPSLPMAASSASGNV